MLNIILKSKSELQLKLSKLLPIPVHPIYGSQATHVGLQLVGFTPPINLPILVPLKKTEPNSPSLTDPEPLKVSGIPMMSKSEILSVKPDLSEKPPLNLVFHSLPPNSMESWDSLGLELPWENKPPFSNNYVMKESSMIVHSLSILKKTPPLEMI